MQKNSNFGHFKDQSYGSNYDNQTSNSISLIYSLSSIHWYVSFQDLQNSTPWGPHFLLSSGLENRHFCAKDDAFKPVNIEILFLRKIW